MANTATGDIAETLAPAFVEIMRQMTPLHARVLAWAYRHSRMRTRVEVRPEGYHFTRLSRATLLEQFPMPVDQFKELVADLVRMRLVESDHVMTSSGGATMLDPVYSSIQLRSRAKLFLEAVNAPGTDLGDISELPTPPPD